MRNKIAYLGDPHRAKQKWKKKELREKVVKDLKAGKSLFKNAEEFWNKEYMNKTGSNFTLSEEAAEDLKKFTRWLERQYKGEFFNNKSFVIDAGCGNGRNLLWMNSEFGVSGLGYDISAEAIKGAKKNASPELQFITQNLNQKIPIEDNKADLLIDAIASHVLNKEEREFFKSEVIRVLSTGSYYFLKSLLLDEDRHAARMIKEYGQSAGEDNSYIHPTMGIFEHVPTEEELINFYKDDFEIEKVERSHAHNVGGKANKRRYIILYLRKK